MNGGQLPTNQFMRSSHAPQLIMCIYCVCVCVHTYACAHVHMCVYMCVCVCSCLATKVFIGYLLAMKGVGDHKK